MSSSKPVGSRRLEMAAATVLKATDPWISPTTSRRASRNADRNDAMLIAGVVAVALALALLVSVLPGFARVPVDSQVVPAPTPAPAPFVLESAR
jgi:hypothetical protein